MSALSGQERGADAIRPRWLVSLPWWQRERPRSRLERRCRAGRPPASNPAHPVVDASWIYANDWYDATHFIYKRAGSDGCLPGAPSCASVPG